MDEFTKDLIAEALRFFVWAAGEGLYAIDASVPDPEESLFAYAQATGDEDYSGYAEKVATLLAKIPAAGIPVREG